MLLGKPSSFLHCNLQCLSHRNLVRRDSGHDNQRVVRNHPQSAVVPALTTLLTTVCVSNSVNDPVDAPDSSENGCRDRPAEARDQKCAEDGGVVLVEVLVRALSRVEGKHGLLGRGRCGLDLLVRCIFEGVGDLCGLAERADAAAVPGANDEGADDGAEDIASGCRWCR